jgi:hypothetical protein
MASIRREAAAYIKAQETVLLPLGPTMWISTQPISSCHIIHLIFCLGIDYSLSISTPYNQETDIVVTHRNWAT